MIRITAIVARGLFVAAPLTMADAGVTTCEEYLANDRGSRTRLVASFLWVWLTENREQLSINQAGSAIAIVPEMRMMLDQQYSTSGGDLAPAAAAGGGRRSSRIAKIAMT